MNNGQRLQLCLISYKVWVCGTKLCAYTHIGTKKLIEAYINEVVKQMNIICDTDSEDFPNKAKLEFFTNTRQSFGRTALLLSGGATFGKTLGFMPSANSRGIPK